jgi:hypothetical protein
LLFCRTALFALFQGLIGAALALLGRQTPGDDAAAWWPIAAALGSLTTLVILNVAFRGSVASCVGTFSALFVGRSGTPSFSPSVCYTTIVKVIYQYFESHP